ncbi:transposase, IS4 family [Leptospira kirschneri str. 2008720114]|nr:transposase, IS4 family [Leptospira kirschneri str. 2008720114]
MQLDYSDIVNWSFGTRCKVFKDIAQRGKSSTGWFYGFKLHLIINDQGELLSFMVTPGNVDDRNLKVIFPLVKNIYGKLFGDRGYISQSLFESLYEKGIQLITKLKKNMKNKLMPLVDKILLRKRAIIESVNDELKNICQIQHTRHRSFFNWAVNLLSGLVAFSFFPKKPSLNLKSKDNLQLLLSP